MKKKRIVIIIVAIITVSIAFIVIRKRLQAKGLPTTNIPTLTKGGKLSLPSSMPTPPSPSEAFPLKMGSRGEYVKRLQAWLNNNPPVPYRQGFLSVDGIFGEKTHGAVNLKFRTDKVDYATFIKNRM